MGMMTSLVIFAASGALVILARVMEKRERPVGQVSWIPWTTIMICGVMVAILMLVHLANLAGIETGRGRPGPGGF